MNEKKVREAIYCIKSFADDTVCEECDNYDRCDHTMVANNARTAIEALEKQLPKEIKAIDPERSEEFGDVEFCCPNCNSHYLCDIADVPNYCPECGIRFDT